MAVISGTAGNDSRSGTSGNDTISLLAGNDRGYGLGGNDTLYGGEGNDSLYGGNGSDRLWGGNGNDLMQGDAGDDRLFGEAGNDMLSGGAGNDAVHGDDGNDTVLGDAGNDFTTGGNGNDTVYGGVGNDTLHGNDGADRLLGDAGNDTMLGGAGNDALFGGDGDDMLRGHSGNSAAWGEVDTLFGGAGNDTFVGVLTFDYDYPSASLTIASFDDGRSTPVRVDLQAGTATRAGGEVDTLVDIFAAIGSSGDDVLIGRSLDDYDAPPIGSELWGGAGNDTLIGSGAADDLFGGDGDDHIDGLYGESWSWGVYAIGGNGDDFITGVRYGSGGDGDDTLIVHGHEDGRAKAFGGAGADYIILSGEWALGDGGSGADVITAGLEYGMTLVGGAGRDVFAFADAYGGYDLDISETYTVIADFRRTQGDFINLRAVDADADRPGNQFFWWIGQAVPTRAGELGYRQEGGDAILHGRLAADGSLDFEIVLVGVTNPDVSWFIL